MASTYELIIKAVDQTSRPTRKIEANLKRLEKQGNRVNKTLKAAGGALAAFATGAVVRSIVKTTARFEDLQDTLVSVVGSAEEGAKAFKGIQKFATKTQFGVEDLTTTYIKLAGAGIKPTTKLLTTFTDAAAVTTDQIGTLTAITDLFSRTTAGGLGLEDLNRLQDRGLPVFDILQEKLGLTRLEISEFGKSAEGAAKITQALADGINQRFGGATEKKVDNLSTAMSNFGIQIGLSAVKLGNELRPQLTAAINDATKFLAANDKLIESLGGGLGTAIETAAKALGVLAQNIDLIRNAIITGIAISAAKSMGTIIGRIARAVAGAKTLAGVSGGMGKALTASLLAPVKLAGKLGRLLGVGGPIGLGILGLVGLFTAFKDKILEINGVSASLGEIVQASFNIIGRAAQTVMQYVVDRFNDFTSKITSIGDYVPSVFSDIFNFMVSSTRKLVNTLIQLYMVYHHAVMQVVYAIPDMFKAAFDAVIGLGGTFGNKVVEQFTNIGTAAKQAFQGDFAGAMETLGKESAFSLSKAFSDGMANIAASSPSFNFGEIFDTDYVGKGFDLYEKSVTRLTIAIGNQLTPAFDAAAGAITNEIGEMRKADLAAQIAEAQNEALAASLDNVKIGAEGATEGITNFGDGVEKTTTVVDRLIENIQQENKDLALLKNALKDVSIIAKAAGVSESELSAELQRQIDLIEGNTKQLETRADKVKTFAEEINDKIKSAGDTLASDMARSLAQGKSVLGDFKNFFNRILDDILQAVIQKNITQPLVDQLTGMMGGMGGGGGLGGLLGGFMGGGGGGGFSFGSIFSGIGSFFGFANGGYPPIGQPSVVGENGPEMIVPGRSSTVMPIDPNGGGTVVNFNINAVDTQSGVEFLLENKPTIVAMIQQASNKRGKVGILD